MSETKDKPATRAIEIDLSIDAPLEAVWKALTDAEELVRWFPLEAGEKPDGTLWMSWGEGFRFEGRPADSNPPHRVRFIYHQPPPGRDPSELAPEDYAEIATEYILETKKGKTVLRLVHSGFGADTDWDDLLDATRTGWQVELRGLRHYLENHRGRPRTVAWARTPFSGPLAEAWARIMSPEVLLAEGSLGGLSEASPYRIRARNGDRFEGLVRLNDPPRNFVGTVANLGNSLLRVRLESHARPEIHMWLSAYTLPRGEVRAFEKKWQAELEGLFSA